MDPTLHEFLSIFRGARNGIIYGGKLRFSHALVMSVMFRSGPWNKRIADVLKATRMHATLLAKFVLVYKGVMFGCKYGRGGRNRNEDAWVAGFIAGYLVFSRSNSSLAQQMVLYVFSRAVLATGNVLLNSLKLDSRDADHISSRTYKMFAALCWAFIMFYYHRDQSTIQRSMLHSLKYLYEESEQWQSISDYFLLSSV